ncbi:MAG: hypothetical protein GY820_46980 [Gammaproteobacteria bacterium]|nr:hypothetical protein [Gammaproteobacteria bacterium]
MQQKHHFINLNGGKTGSFGDTKMQGFYPFNTSFLNNYFQDWGCQNRRKMILIIFYLPAETMFHGMYVFFRLFDLVPNPETLLFG